MKKINKRYIILVILILNLANAKAGFFDFFPFGFDKKTNKQDKLIITSVIHEKEHQLNSLKKEKDNLENTQKEFTDSIQKDLNALNTRIYEIKEKLKQPNENKEYYNKILAKLNEISQILIDIQLKRNNLLTILNQHIEVLVEYINDPTFKNKSIEPKSSYNFENLDLLQRDIANYEEEITNLHEEKSNLEINLEALKKDLSATDKELRNKEKEQKRFSAKPKDESKDKLSLNQKGEIIDIDIQLLANKKKLNELKIKEEQYKLGLVNTNLFISESVYKNLKYILPNIIKSLWISESDIEKANKTLADKKRESTELQAKYSEEIRRIAQEKEKLKLELENLSKQYKINNLKSLCDWSIETKNLDYEPIIYQLGYINDRILTLDKAIVFKDSQREYEKELIKSEEILVEITNFWHKISQRKFKTEEEIESERKKFEHFRDEFNKDHSIYKDKINTINNLNNNQSKIHTNILEKIKSLNERSENFISRFGQETFKNSYTLLNNSEEQIKLQTDLNNKIIENYSNIVYTIKDSLQQINNILSKVENIGGILLRSKYAITWDNIKNIIPDLKLFSSDLGKLIYPAKISTNKLFKNFIKNSTNFSYILQLIIQIFLIIIIFLFFKRALPYIYFLLLSIKPSMPGVYFVNCLLAILIGFIVEHYVSIYLWSLIFFLIKFDILTNLTFKVLFYLISIPYLCFLSAKFIKHFITFNKKHNYPLISQSFENRFAFVFLFFVYSTVIIFFFIEAFSSITYGKSELPTILLAIYSIIFRALLIFLIGKEEILSIIPEKPGFWLWTRTIVNKTYYLLLMAIIAIMIISDPYIGGFSKLVSFILWSLIYTIFLITALWWLQVLIRRLSSTIFFKSEEDEAAKERFHYAKTFYGLFSVLSFLFFISIAVFVGAKIWNLPISFEKITEFLNVTIFSVKGESDQVIPITTQSFIVLFTFLFFGFIIASAFDRFILRRIFDILLVDQGVQNTVSNITYYFIVIIILLVGLLRIGLSGLIPFLVGALAVGIAFAIKGPANDFIGYFVILVERSIKIGDYVEINKETKGVVRKITPRSIVIRSKNSTSVIVPNSTITNSSFSNWNYVPGFIAFEDILLTISFNNKPEEIISILRQSVLANSNILKSPAPIIWLDDFAEHGYIFRVRGFLSSVNVLNQWEIASDIRISIVKALREKGIQIAAPVRRIILPENTDKAIF